MTKSPIAAIAVLVILVCIQTIRLHRLQGSPSAAGGTETVVSEREGNDVGGTLAVQGSDTRTAKPAPGQRAGSETLWDASLLPETPGLALPAGTLPDTGALSGISSGDGPALEAGEEHDANTGTEKSKDRERKNARRRAAALFREAVLRLEDGNYEEALSLLDQSLEENPGDRRAYVNMARIYRMMGMEDEELGVYSDWAAAIPDSPEPHYHLARVYERMGFDGEAAAQVDAALALAGEDPRVFAQTALLYRRLGLREDERDILTEWVGSMPDSASAHVALGGHYTQMGDHEAALAEYRAASQLEPDNPQTHLGLASLYQDMNRFDDALDSLFAAAELRPDDPYIQFRIASSLRASGQRDASVDYYQSVIDARPDSPLARRAQRVLDQILGSGPN